MATVILVGRDEKETKQFDWFITDWQKELLALDPNLDLRVWPDVGDLNEIKVALVWRHPLGILKKFPQLKCIMSLAAGVDHVLLDSELQKHIPVARVMDSYMAYDIVQYVMVCVLDVIKRMDVWAANQLKKIWARTPPFNFSDKTIGIMGLGFLGEKAARALAHVGLKVVGWSQTSKNISGITSYIGDAEFSQFLAGTDILVCMLPLTNKTRDILNNNTFSQLPVGAYVINLGRGEHLVENDLLKALATGHLSGACLDVFRQEPLPSDHPFWLQPKIKITPHIASVTNPHTAAPQVFENICRVHSNEEIINRVDLEKGY